MLLETITIDEFMATFKISAYRLSKLLDMPESTISDWRKRGCKHPVVLSLALRELGRVLKKGKKLGKRYKKIT